ncbi:MAG TPA: cobalamin biosynthesis protein [Pseudonocardia sp.]|nr:cobalamin biosynthesis protein [Pseudonocardia sp.]
MGTRLSSTPRRSGQLGPRAAGLLLGTAADALLGDPVRWHPVAGFGRFAGRLETYCYADSRTAGAAYAGLATGAAIAAGAAVARLTRAHPVLETITVAAGTWVVLGGASLAGEAAALAGALEAGELAAARARIPNLCGRDPEALDAAGMARAAAESVAENTSDAVVGPLLWGALAGVPGLLGYRAVNTLDAMVGYRSPRYRRFGWAAARTDDLVNLLPARLTALLTVIVAGPLGGSPVGAARAWRRDAGGHPSPNAGPVEASAAGALGIRLGGLTQYPHGVELRPVLGSGPAPTPADLRRMVRLSRVLGWSAAGVAALAAELLARRR